VNECLKITCPGETPLVFFNENHMSRRRGSAKDLVSKNVSLKITCPGETPLVFDENDLSRRRGSAKD